MVVGIANQPGEHVGWRGGGQWLGDDGTARTRMHPGIGDNLAIRPVNECLGVRGGVDELIQQRLGEVGVQGWLAGLVVLYGTLAQRTCKNTGLLA